jgi:hypothetical protein
MAPNSNFVLGEFVLLGRLPIAEFTQETFCPFWGPMGPFGVQGLQIKFYCGGIFPFGESPKLKFYSGAFVHCGTYRCLLVFRGPKPNVTLWAFFLLRSLTNSNFSLGLLLILGLTRTFWCSGAQI